jgi:hypothetical protein
MNSFVIPCHEKKLEWLEAFCKSAKGNTNIIVAATDNTEVEVFRKALINFDIPIEYLSCDGYTKNMGWGNIVNPGNKGIINIKKFVALHYAMRRNEYMMCIDCDTKVNTTTDAAMTAAIQNYRYHFYGVPTAERAYYKMNYASIQLFEEEYIPTLAHKTHGGNLYTWFFDAPLYKTDDLVEFFEYMRRGGSIGDFLSRLTCIKKGCSISQLWRHRHL